MRPERKTSSRAFNVADDASLIVGYGSTFEPPERHDFYGDIIAPGAFEASIVRDGPAGAGEITYDYEHRYPFGKFRTLKEDGHGLLYEAMPVATQENSDRVAYIKARLVRGSSIGFYARKTEEIDYETPWGAPVRRILVVDLVEISAVRQPANPYALIDDVKAVKHWAQTDDGMWLPAEWVARGRAERVSGFFADLEPEDKRAFAAEVARAMGDDVALIERLAEAVHAKGAKVIEEVDVARLEAADSATTELLERLSQITGRPHTLTQSEAVDASDTDDDAMADLELSALTLSTEAFRMRLGLAKHGGRQ